MVVIFTRIDFLGFQDADNQRNQKVSFILNSALLCPWPVRSKTSAKLSDQGHYYDCMPSSLDNYNLKI